MQSIRGFHGHFNKEEAQSFAADFFPVSVKVVDLGALTAFRKASMQTLNFFIENQFSPFFCQNDKIRNTSFPACRFKLS